MNTPQISVIGATTRAAAAMCRRAGYMPTCFDQFADLDLQEIAEKVNQIHFNEQGLPSLDAQAWSQETQNRPWFYTGPIENQPDWIEAAESDTTLWGNGASVVKKVRSPWLLADLCRDFGEIVQVPEMLPIGETKFRKSCDWLWKPIASSGGWTIQKARKRLSERRESSDVKDIRKGYWQKRVRGTGFGITIASDGSKAVAIGGCVSFRGAPNRPFAYSGSEGPAQSRVFQQFIARLGPLLGHLTATTGLKGLWNMDVVYESRHKRWYLLEINPRISASMEALELVAGQSLLKIHFAIFQNDESWIRSANEFAESVNRSKKRVIKSIIYCYIPLYPARIRRLRRFVRPFQLWPESSVYADFPATDSQIPAGLPLCTTIHIFD